MTDYTTLICLPPDEYVDGVDDGSSLMRAATICGSGCDGRQLDGAELTGQMWLITFSAV